MKKSYLFSFLLFTFLGFSQTSININITLECQPISGVYAFGGILNGKNDYF